MQRAVVLAYPTYGHIAPILPVVAELVRRGVDVVFYGTGRSRAKIEATGARYRAYARGHDDFNPTPPTDGLFSDMARLAALSEDILPGLLAELRDDAPDCLLFDTKSLWGRLAAQFLGIRAVTMSVVFAIKDGMIPVPQLTASLYGGAPAAGMLGGLLGLGEYYEAARRLTQKYGTEAPGIIGYLGNPQALNIIFTSREFQLGGDAFGAEYVFVGPSIPAVRNAAVDFPFDQLDGRPLVYVSLGTTFHDAPAFYRACFEGLGDGPWQVVLATGGVAMDLGIAPANFLVRSFVPQLALLEHARVFVTHGGMNSANEGLYFGVPLVVVPQRGDQFIVAGRTAELGAGVPIFPREVNAGRLLSAVEAVLGGVQFGERARELGASLRNAGGYVRAADAIESFAAR